MPTPLIDDGAVHILDGGLATALELRGHNLNHPLWSGKLLAEQPDEIRKVHLDYYRVGADIAITASYQASVPGLIEHLKVDHESALEVIRSSVRLAQAARDEAYREGIARELLVAGSVGPYGAYLANGAEYTGDYKQVTEAELRSFHRERIAALVEAGADLLACETMPNILEIRVLCDLLKDHNIKAWISCTLRDESHISDGTSLAEVARVVEGCVQVVSIGINCVPFDMATGALRVFSKVHRGSLVVYPNSGEKWDAEKKVWYGETDTRDKHADEARIWHGLGARLIGGCCRMGFDDIRAMSRSLGDNSQG